MDDMSIVDLYFDRNQKALSETKNKYEKYLYKIAYNILGDISDSEESVNDTYLAAWESIPPARPFALSLYLGKLTRRISIDILRKKTAAKRGSSQYLLSLEELKDCVSGGDNMAEVLEDKELGKEISAFLRTLSPEVRGLFVARYYFMDSLKAAAKSFGMTESKAKSLLFRTRKSLKEHLEKEGYVV